MFQERPQVKQPATVQYRWVFCHLCRRDGTFLLIRERPNTTPALLWLPWNKLCGNLNVHLRSIEDSLPLVFAGELLLNSVKDLAGGKESTFGKAKESRDRPARESTFDAIRIEKIHLHQRSLRYARHICYTFASEAAVAVACLVTSVVLLLLLAPGRSLRASLSIESGDEGAGITFPSHRRP